jgi:signal transduction histidine kinase
VATEVVDLLKARAEEFNIKLTLNSANELEPVAMDVTGIHQCLVNLVNNAIDACRPEICGHEDGQVTLRICRHPHWAVCLTAAELMKAIRKRSLPPFSVPREPKEPGWGC